MYSHIDLNGSLDNKRLDLLLLSNLYSYLGHWRSGNGDFLAEAVGLAQGCVVKA